MSFSRRDVRRVLTLALVAGALAVAVQREVSSQTGTGGTRTIVPPSTGGSIVQIFVWTSGREEE